jgi:beta-glucosidase
VLDGDLDTIAAPIDVLGVNYYTRQVSGPDGPVVRPGTPVTDMDWEIYPRGLADTMRWLHRTYRFDEYLITENGAAMADEADADGEVDDVDRVEYLRDHLRALHGVLDEVPVRGYFVWSLLDNFEWEHGYGKRFGIVRVDYDTLVRTPKASARWYAAVARTGRIG